MDGTHSQQIQDKIDAATRDLAQAQTELKQAKNELAQIHEQVSTLTGNCTNLTEQIELMESTRLWRITRPLSKLYRLLMLKGHDTR